MTTTVLRPADAAKAQRRPQPFSMVIHGATGDLTSRKLAPALYRLALDGHLPDQLLILGVARRPWTDEVFRETLRGSVQASLGDEAIDESAWSLLDRSLYYVPGDAGDPDSYRRIDARLTELGRAFGSRPDRNRLYYLATLPSLYPDLIRGFGELERARSGGWGRIVVEKPFGRDQASAAALNRLLADYFSEADVYRIDHYLGKETVQNVLVFRFANGIFEPLWNRHYIDHVQITVAEDIGVEHRGAYFEEAGILRDMVQNHLLQLLCLVAMEPPASFDAGAIRDEKVKVFRSIPLPGFQQVDRQTVRGQYGPGLVNGRQVPGYREEPNVEPDSQTETFAALRIGIENWRWAGVPFFLRSGKRLPERVSEIVVSFRRAPHMLFRGTMAPDLRANTLTLHLQPKEGITLSFGVKAPGPEIRVRNRELEFFYDRAFQERSAAAYEYLLLEAMLGDTTMFTRADEVEASWSFMTAVHDAWAQGASPLRMYPAGSWGPPEAERLLLEGLGRREPAAAAADGEDPWRRHLGA